MEAQLAERTAILERLPESENSCHHYWMIETAEGPTSKGRCKFCGEEREFYNYLRNARLEGFVPTPSDSFDSWNVEPQGEEDSF